MMTRCARRSRRSSKPRAIERAVRIRHRFPRFPGPRPRACVLLDVKMPRLDGLEVQRRLNDCGAMLPVVILTGHGDVAMAVQAMRAGAADFLEKPVSRERLLASVARAIDSRRDARQDQRERSDIGARLGALTTRERQVLEQLVMGRTNKVAAHELGISSRTVEVYPPERHGENGRGQLSHLVPGDAPCRDRPACRQSPSRTRHEVDLPRDHRRRTRRRRFISGVERAAAGRRTRGRPAHRAKVGVPIRMGVRRCRSVLVRKDKTGNTRRSPLPMLRGTNRR